MTEAFPLIEVSGTPHKRGVMYGRQASQRIRKGVVHHGGQLARLQLDSASVGEIGEGLSADHRRLR
jgi:isopenicillin-N N-acyltransferase-like protein